MLRYLTLIVAAFTCILMTASADAQQAVQCRSVDRQYNECRAGPMRQPVLVQQISKSACIPGRSWGYNPKTQYIWVGDGCSGVFADAARPAAGSHRAGGNELGVAIAGTLLGAVLEGMAEDNHHHHRKHARGDDDIDTRPQFDRQGNPNFDTHGNYQGCHGAGCDVDIPDN